VCVWHCMKYLMAAWRLIISGTFNINWYFAMKRDRSAFIVTLYSLLLLTIFRTCSTRDFALLIIGIVGDSIVVWLACRICIVLRCIFQFSHEISNSKCHGWLSFYGPSERLPYDTELKLKVILYAAEHGNRAEGYKFIVNESNTCYWRNDRASLLSCKKSKKSFTEP
jgi:hypothetical protein